MSGRRGRSSTRSGSVRPRIRGEKEADRSRSPVSRNRTMTVALDHSLPGNWTTSKLKMELQKKGISLPHTTPHKTLLKLFQQLENNGESLDKNSSDASRVNNNSACTQNDDVTDNNGGAHEMTNKQ